MERKTARCGVSGSRYREKHAIVNGMGLSESEWVTSIISQASER